MEKKGDSYLCVMNQPQAVADALIQIFHYDYMPDS